MNRSEFVFLDKRPQRYVRHIVFWTLWWCYFYGGRYFYPKPLLAAQQGIILMRSDNKNRVERPFNDYWETAHIWGTSEFIRSLLMLSVHILGCYALIYFLLPRLLLKAKYILFLLAILLLGFMMILTSRFIDTVVMHGIAGNRNNAYTPYYSSIFEGVVNAIKIIAVATAIKLGKHWWFKQKEKERLEKEKIDAELQLLKAQIHPQFLFSTLNNIYSFSLTASPKAPDMLLKLSDILSYMLYDCNQKEVLLSKEIKMLMDYISLEKMRYGDLLEMSLQIKDDKRDDKIAPFLLLKFIENSFRQCSSNSIAQAWINLEIQIENSVLEMKLLNGKSLENTVEENGEENELVTAEKMLGLLYPDRHTLRLTDEPEIMIVTLQLQLGDSNTQMESLKQQTTETGSLKITGTLSATNISF